MNRDDLLAFVGFAAYANKIIVDAAAQLTDEEVMRKCSPSHETVFELLKHMYGGEWVYLRFCQGQPFDPSPIEAITTFPALRDAWLTVSDDMVAFVRGLDDAAVNRDITLSFGGEQSWRLPLWKTLLMTLVHSMHHRGELSIVMTTLGHPLPDIDIMVYWLEQSGQPVSFD